jgi:hypothetical protein
VLIRCKVRVDDHDFQGLFPKFGEKLAVFSKGNVVIHLLQKLQKFLSENANFLCKNYFKIQTPVPVVCISSLLFVFEENERQKDFFKDLRHFFVNINKRTSAVIGK